MAQSSEQSAKVVRGPGRPFEKGISGNPGGRPKSAGPLRELARQHTEAAISVLVEALSDEDARVRVVAANALLDRGHGRPTSSIEVDAHVEIEENPPTTLELARQIAFALAVAMRAREAEAATSDESDTSPNNQNRS